MPFSSKRPCTYPGCSTLTRTGRCSKHPPTDHRKAQRNARYDARYTRIRNRYIAENPVCELQQCCNGDPATEVDHIIAIANGGDVHDTDNMQSVCRPCHRWKTIHIDGFSGSHTRADR